MWSTLPRPIQETIQEYATTITYQLIDGPFHMDIGLFETAPWSILEPFLRRAKHIPHHVFKNPNCVDWMIHEYQGYYPYLALYNPSEKWMEHVLRTRTGVRRHWRSPVLFWEHLVRNPSEVAVTYVLTWIARSLTIDVHPYLSMLVKNPNPRISQLFIDHPTWFRWYRTECQRRTDDIMVAFLQTRSSNRPPLLQTLYQGLPDPSCFLWWQHHMAHTTDVSWIKKLLACVQAGLPIHEHQWMKNPHPLIVAHLLSLPHMDPKAFSNPSDVWVEHVLTHLLPRLNETFSRMHFCLNPHPKAQEWMRANWLPSDVWHEHVPCNHALFFEHEEDDREWILSNDFVYHSVYQRTSTSFRNILT